MWYIDTYSCHNLLKYLLNNLKKTLSSRGCNTIKHLIQLRSNLRRALAHEIESINDHRHASVPSPS